MRNWLVKRKESSKEYKNSRRKERPLHWGWDRAPKGKPPSPISGLRCRPCWRGHSCGLLDERSHCGATAMELARILPSRVLGKLFIEKCVCLEKLLQNHLLWERLVVVVLLLLASGYCWLPCTAEHGQQRRWESCQANTLEPESKPLSSCYYV